MKKILTISFFCLCIYNSNGQTKIDTVSFETAVDRILADYTSNYQNIKAIDSCASFCHLNFYIPSTYYPFCEVSRSFSKEQNYTCTITYSQYDFKPENSEKYRD